MFFHVYDSLKCTLFTGIFGRIWSRFVSIFQYVYLFISSVLCFDTWLLCSSNAENRNKKRFLLLLLILLPLLLLTGKFFKSFICSLFSFFSFPYSIHDLNYSTLQIIGNNKFYLKTNYLLLTLSRKTQSL